MARVSQIPPAKPEAWKIMDRLKRLAVLDSSENIRMVLDYRAIVIPAALLSWNPADFRRLVYSYSQRFKLATDTFKGPDEKQEPGFRLKHCRNDDLTPGNVKLCESAGRAGGLPCHLRLKNAAIAAVGGRFNLERQRLRTSRV